MAIRHSSLAERSRVRTGTLLAALIVSAPALFLAAPSAAAAPPAGKKVNARPLDPTRIDVRQRLLLQAALAQFGTQPFGTRIALLGMAQAVAKRPAPEPAGTFWFDRPRAAAAASAQVTGVGDPFAALVMVTQGRRLVVWDEPEPNRAPALNADWLASVRDGKPFMDLRGKAADELLQPRNRGGYEEYRVYSQAVVLAHQTAVDLFAKNAAENSHLNFDQLFVQPKKYRGEIVHMEGLLKRLSREDAPVLAQRQGVPHVYVGWIYLHRPNTRTPPVCVHFTDLPANLKEGEDLNRKVSFDGYFFKKWGYEVVERDAKGQARKINTLMFVAPTLKGQPAARSDAQPSSPLPGPVLFGIIGFVAITVGLMLGINLWYRRTDRQVRARLHRLEDQRFAEEEGAFSEPEPPGDGKRNGTSPPASGEAPGHGTTP